MNLNFLNKEQALSYFNKQTAFNADKKTFLIYCLENKVSIKYKAVTDFEAIAGFFISDYEYSQLKEHQKINCGYGDEDDNTIFANGSFDTQSASLTYKFYEHTFPKEFNSNLPLIKLNAITKSSELVKETEDYKNLLSNKESIDRLTKITESSRILCLDEDKGALVFHAENTSFIERGVYDFLDSSLSVKGAIEAEIHSSLNYDSFMPYESRFFIFNNHFYYKPDQKSKNILDAFGCNEIFQQGFLKSDIDCLIKKLSQEVKHKENVDVLHTRTANNASKIISALCELNGLDTTQPFGHANKEIMAILDRLGTPLSKDAVGDWLKLAHENTK
ncbi:hypothetical protein AMQ28_04255 [Acinetobacter sp. TTH0-4]|uniref:hypothetical protein n=1 Tax=Acinetobacter sp. TTH0-4 TaxID=1646498 RepID=UPI0006B064AC|nr:hypothetical protein [Acinetobacter sp. TTH0-4]ALD01641.1 hypothetical protein AMQ28_04255 [Acinetobacter sp. TTH0-4]